MGLATADASIAADIQKRAGSLETETVKEDAASSTAQRQESRSHTSDERQGGNYDGGEHEMGDESAPRRSFDAEDGKATKNDGDSNFDSRRTSPTASSSPSTDDEQTYLDLFGERAKELFTQHIIPATDAECRWDWRYARCEPQCDCALRFLWGDYHLGRSCRKYVPRRRKGGGSPAQWMEMGRDAEEWTLDDDDPEAARAATCGLPPETPYAEVVRRTSRSISRTRKAVSTAEVAVKGFAAKTRASGRRRWGDAAGAVCRAVHTRAAAREKRVVVTKRGVLLLRALCGNATAAVFDGRGDGGVDGEVPNWVYGGSLEK